MADCAICHWGLSWCSGCNLFCTHQVADDIITCHNTFSREAERVVVERQVSAGDMFLRSSFQVFKPCFVKPLFHGFEREPFAGA